MLVGPEGILAVDPVEANVGPIAVAVGEPTDVAPSVNCRAVGVDAVEALVPFDVEVLLP